MHVLPRVDRGILDGPATALAAQYAWLNAFNKFQCDVEVPPLMFSWKRIPSKEADWDTRMANVPPLAERFFLIKLSEHVDGERRRGCADVKACKGGAVIETSPMLPSDPP